MNGVAKYCQRRWLWSGGMLPSSPLNWAWQALNMDRERDRERGERESVSGANKHHAARFFKPLHQARTLTAIQCLSPCRSLSLTHTGMYTYTQSPVINYLAWLARRLTANAN